MENNEETKVEETTEEESAGDETQDTGKQWLQDNLRIIVSVLIVVVIAGGIYSYSKRTEAPTQEGTTESASILNPDESEKNIAENKPLPGQEVKTQPNAETPEKTAPTEKTPTAQTQEKNVASAATSQETDRSFIETAGKGDSQTKLARRALANYLEKTPDSNLTPEHKIYIEDYLRKKVAQKGRILVGTSVEFDKGLIQDAITKSKTLNQGQLQNLHKYAVRVPSLS